MTSCHIEPLFRTNPHVYLVLVPCMPKRFLCRAVETLVYQAFRICLSLCLVRASSTPPSIFGPSTSGPHGPVTPTYIRLNARHCVFACFPLSSHSATGFLLVADIFSIRLIPYHFLIQADSPFLYITPALLISSLPANKLFFS